MRFLPWCVLGLVGTSACSETSPAAARPPVASVEVAAPTADLAVGDTVVLTVTVRDQDGAVLTDRTVAWSSSNASAASVTGAGAVLGLAPGSTTITASVEGRAGSVGLAVARSTVARVTVTPASAVLSAVGASVQLTAQAYDGAGNALTGSSFKWSSANPAVATVSSSGLVTARATGTVQIAAAIKSVRGYAAVTVALPAPVARVAVTPAADTLSAVGATAQLSAQAYDAADNPLAGQTYAWSSSNTTVATVGSTGLVTAQAAGNAQITATVGSVQGSATIVVLGAPPVAGECASPRSGWIWCDDFEQDRTASYFEYDRSNGNFTRTAGAGFGGSYGMRAHWNAGQVGAGSLHLAFGRTPDPYIRPVDAGTANYRELYWRVYVRNQPGWVGGGADKLTRATILATSSWAQAMIAHVWSGSSNPGYNYLVIDPASGTDAQGNLLTTTYNDFSNLRWLGAAQGITPLFDAQHVGQWYCLEAHVRLNGAGSADGVFELWINGGLEARRTGLDWVGSYSAFGINALFLENYWNNGAPVAEDRDLDNLVVSTQPIGCL